jgi:hypothetical protein
VTKVLKLDIYTADPKDIEKNQSHCMVSK